MIYQIKAHPTIYKGVQFRSRLEAHWAAFFDLAGFKWEYEPLDLVGWTPDFRIEIPCGHSECNGKHVLLAEVKPFYSLEEFAGHPCMKYMWGWNEDNTEEHIPADSSAALGVNPSVVHFEMVHGAGGGEHNDFEHWGNLGRQNHVARLWIQAGNTVQWKP